MPASQVDVWFASLDVSNPALERARGTLARDEAERAGRFHFTRDRDRYVAGRGLLRALLADYTGTRPEAIAFEYGPYGKPRLRDGGAVTFNVSHSADRAVFAVTHGVEVGVDIEVLDAKHSDELVARQFFSRTEVEEYLSVPAESRQRAFLTCWTRKEAYIKARGEGLNLPLQDFDVTLVPGSTPELRRTAWSATEPAEWRLFDVSREGCVAALAVRAERARVEIGEAELGAAGLERRPSSGVAAGTHVAAEA
jgi:4'-phosphopantetheinyl transferase